MRGWKGEAGERTADKLAHFCCVSTGDGNRGGERGGSLQHGWLRGNDNRRLSDSCG